MNGMQMKEYVVIPPAVAGNATAVARWIREGFEFASTLPPRQPKGAAKPKATGACKKTATKAAKNKAPVGAGRGASDKDQDTARARGKVGHDPSPSHDEPACARHRAP
jgi:hypothetical protein